MMTNLFTFRIMFIIIILLLLLNGNSLPDYIIKVEPNVLGEAIQWSYTGVIIIVVLCKEYLRVKTYCFLIIIHSMYYKL